jgi:hypothetical protein
MRDHVPQLADQLQRASSFNLMMANTVEDG